MPAFKYTTTNLSCTKHAMTAWSFIARERCTTTVLPDGCQDFILSRSEHAKPDWFVSDLSHSAYTVPTEQGEQLLGLRLKPGTWVDTKVLSRWLASNEPDALFSTDQMDEFCFRPAALTEALECLAAGLPTVKSVARELGTSSRSLQRLTQSKTGLPPRFWWALARARRTARTLPSFENLADAAEACGFADQAHMTRDMQKWFAVTPKQLRSNDGLLAQLNDTGYG